DRGATAGTGIWTVRFWPPAEHDVAGEQALVLPTFTIGGDRILPGRRGRLIHGLLRLGRGCRSLSLLSLACVHGTQPLLVIAQTIGIRCQRSWRCWRRSCRRLGLARDEDDQNNAERETRH